MTGARQRRRRRRQLIASMGEREGSPCQQDCDDGDSGAGKSKTMTSSIPELPADILFRIHSLMPMREAARAACVSHAFLHSWRCHPNLIFTKDTIGFKKSACRKYSKKFHRKIDRILRNFIGISLKTFKLDDTDMCGFDGTSYLDSWLQIALKPGIEEFTLVLSEAKEKYSFPCSLLSDRVRNSLRYLKLCFCDIHPTVELAPLRMLASLQLSFVTITWEELEHLLSNSLALERLELTHCVEITCLKLPSALQRLSSLIVIECSSLKVIESKAPNLSSFYHTGHWVDLLHVETLKMRKLDMGQRYSVHDARAKLPSIMPNLETLVIRSGIEVVDAPMLPTKFLYLKHLTISFILGHISSRSYDYFSLVSFFDASPSLETLKLDVFEEHMLNKSIFEDSKLSHMPIHHHAYLKSVEISRFTSAKSLVELVCYILQNAVSLERLTLDTINALRWDQSKFKRCTPMSDDVLMEAPRVLSAIRSYIESGVPSTVELTVMQPCSQCLDRGNQLVSSQLCNGVFTYGYGPMYKEMKNLYQV